MHGATIKVIHVHVSVLMDYHQAMYKNYKMKDKIVNTHTHTHTRHAIMVCQDQNMYLI